MVLSTAIPTLIAATVIVIISRGILNNPNNPITEDATKIFGIKPINITFKDLKIKNNIKEITAKTIISELIWDWNNDWSILLYNTAKPVISYWDSSKLNLFWRSLFIFLSKTSLFKLDADSFTLVDILTTESSLLM